MSWCSPRLTWSGQLEMAPVGTRQWPAASRRSSQWASAPWGALQYLQVSVTTITASLVGSLDTAGPHQRSWSVNGLIGALSSTLYRKPAPRDSTDCIAGPVTTSAWHLTAVQHCTLLLCQLPWDVAAHTPLDSQQCDNSRTIGHGSAF